MKEISNQTFGEERALYNLQDANVLKCRFEGEEDGESALKEARNINVEECYFALRYPLWHVQGFHINKIEMTETCRAPLWYSRNGDIVNSKIRGVKTLRECEVVSITGCHIESTEFGWRCNNIKVNSSDIVSEYLFFETKNMQIDNFKMKGKYSFQYVENVTITNSELDTKDAFWHSKNVTVINSTIKGEYLAWFAENLTLINCHIIGTQPLCYCKSLKLINCTTELCDFSFEYSEVDADIIGNIISIKNPKSGTIRVNSVDEIINDNPVMECTGKVMIK